MHSFSVADASGNGADDGNDLSGLYPFEVCGSIGVGEVFDSGGTVAGFFASKSKACE
jgi:hypothetical protein